MNRNKKFKWYYLRINYISYFLSSKLFVFGQVINIFKQWNAPNLECIHLNRTNSRNVLHLLLEFFVKSFIGNFFNLINLIELSKIILDKTIFRIKSNLCEG